MEASTASVTKVSRETASPAKVCAAHGRLQEGVVKGSLATNLVAGSNACVRLVGQSHVTGRVDLAKRHYGDASYDIQYCKHKVNFLDSSNYVLSVVCVLYVNCQNYGI